MLHAKQQGDLVRAWGRSASHCKLVFPYDGGVYQDFLVSHDVVQALEEFGSYARVGPKDIEGSLSFSNVVFVKDDLIVAKKVELQLLNSGHDFVDVVPLPHETEHQRKNGETRVHIGEAVIAAFIRVDYEVRKV